MGEWKDIPGKLGRDMRKFAKRAAKWPVQKVIKKDGKTFEIRVKP